MEQPYDDLYTPLRFFLLMGIYFLFVLQNKFAYSCGIIAMCICGL